MNGEQRRETILSLLRSTSTPLSGGAIGDATGVSRQIIVQDIALLRREGHAIVSTVRGYLLDAPVQAMRKIKVCHNDNAIEDELTTIIDLGGSVMDVMVNHKIYGKITAEMNIHNRRDIRRFLEDMHSGKSSPLLNVTSGYHYHHITAESDAVLDEIEEALRQKDYLAPVAPSENHRIAIEK